MYHGEVKTSRATAFPRKWNAWAKVNNMWVVFFLSFLVVWLRSFPIFFFAGAAIRGRHHSRIAEAKPGYGAFGVDASVKDAI